MKTTPNYLNFSNPPEDSRDSSPRHPDEYPDNWSKYQPKGGAKNSQRGLKKDP